MWILPFVGCEREDLPVQTDGGPFTVPDEVEWSAAPGFTFVRGDIVTDLDGDGLSDVVVALLSDTEYLNLVVYSPLRRELTLPGDESATLPSDVGAVDVAGDVTGDGITDLRVVGWDDYLLFEGPIAGDLGDGTPSAGAFLDSNQDGQLDEHAFRFEAGTANMTLEITFGPMSRWEGEPDVVLDPSCNTDSSDWGYSPPTLWPDFVGDGSPRLLFPAATYSADCQAWWIPLPLPRGVYAPDLDPDAIPASHGFNVLPDQTGDGIADLVFPLIDARDLYAGPLVVLDGEAITGELVAPLPASVFQMVPIPFDLNQDGIGEFLVRDLEPGTTTLVYGGADGLIEAAAAPSWEGTAERAFLEDGIVSIWIPRGDRAVVIDLAAGMALP